MTRELKILATALACVFLVWGGFASCRGVISLVDAEVAKDKEIRAEKSASLTDAFRGRKVVKCELVGRRELLIVLDNGDTVSVHSFKHSMTVDVSHRK